MKQELVDFKDVISSLQLLSKKVSPMKQRKTRMKGKVPVKAVCSYKNMQVYWLCKDVCEMLVGLVMSCFFFSITVIKDYSFYFQTSFSVGDLFLRSKFVKLSVLPIPCIFFVVDDRLIRFEFIWHVAVTKCCTYILSPCVKCFCNNPVNKPIAGLPCHTILIGNLLQWHVAASSHIVCHVMYVILSGVMVTVSHVTVTSRLVWQDLNGWQSFYNLKTGFSYGRKHLVPMYMSGILSILPGILPILPGIP